MRLFIRKPSTVRIRLNGVVYTVPAGLAEKLTYLDRRLAELIEENDGIVDATAKMREHHKAEHERQQRRIDALVDEKHRLRIQADAHKRALRVKQAEVDNALAECKLLHRQLSELDAENLSLNGELSTAREEIARLRLAVTT